MEGLLGNITYNLTNLLSALVILVAGWVVVSLLTAGLRTLLRKAKIGERVGKWLNTPAQQINNVEGWLVRIIYWLLMVLVLLAFFQALQLTIITEPLNRMLVPVFEFVPRLFAAGLLFLVAWVVASILRLVVKRTMDSTNIDERLGAEGNLSSTLSEALYWLVFVLFLPAILDALQMYGLLGPMQQMLGQFMGFLPNLFGAVVIFLVGSFLARMVQKIATNLSAAAGVDNLGERVGLSAALGARKLSELLGLTVYVLIFIPVITAALNALALDAVTGPVSNMLDSILSAMPLVFGAMLIVALAYVVGRVVSNLVSGLLAGFGFNRIMVILGLGREPKEGERTPAQFVGGLVMIGFLLLAAMQASEMLGFSMLTLLIGDFTVFAGQLVAALLIFGIGLYLANLAASAIEASQAAQKGLLAMAARAAIWVLSGTMALRQLGLAADIINLAFGLLLGAIAVAVALAFGLGGRETAGKVLEEWRENLKK